MDDYGKNVNQNMSLFQGSEASNAYHMAPVIKAAVSLAPLQLVLFQCLLTLFYLFYCVALLEESVT